MKVRIVAAVVDTKRLILYKEDGKTIDIPQGDPRVRTIIEQVLPIVRDRKVAEVDLEFAIENPYKEFEEKSGGLVRFFRSAKKAVAGIFGSDDEVTPGVFGEIPDASIGLTTAIDEIIANAEPVNTDTHDPKTMTEAQTMIAVVDGPQGKRVIPGVEKLVKQFGHSAKIGNTKGLNALLVRMAGYIDKRGHSVEDLLKFLEAGDLPIANDGSIIAYKRLFKMGEGKDAHYVDPHTRKVRQRVGSYVCIPEEKVDKNRRNECSSGLHIGRRGYMGSFSGNVIVLCKIAPEDVIVVPHRDPNKVRVCAYHILAELSDAAFNEIIYDRAMTTKDGAAKLLGQVIAGNHVARLEQVLITGDRGEGVIITPMIEGKVVQTVKGPVAPATAIDDPRNVPAPSVADPKQVAVQVGQVKAQGARQILAGKLWAIVASDGTFTHGPAKRTTAARELVAFKKASKVSWTALGLSPDQAARVMNIADGTEVLPATPKQAKPKSTAGKARPAAKKAKPASAPKEKAKPAPVLEAPVRAKESKALSRSDQVRLWRDQLDTNHINDAQKAVVARQMLDSRRAWKKSWAALGLPATTDEELKAVINAAPIDVPHVVKTPKAKKVKVNPDTQVGGKNHRETQPAPLSKQAQEAVRGVLDKKLAEIDAGLKPPVPIALESRSQTARRLFTEQKWGSLLTWKRTTKLGWKALGFTPDETALIEQKTK